MPGEYGFSTSLSRKGKDNRGNCWLAANKKARLSQTGLEYLDLKGLKSFDLTYLSRYSIGMELAPYLPRER
jgi:hypothetical protein